MGWVMEEVGERSMKLVCDPVQRVRGWRTPGLPHDTGDPRRRGHVTSLIAGARVMTEHGLIAVEALCPGDRVLTLDHGLRPLLGCDRVNVASQGRFAAVSVPAGTFGDHGALRVAPQHRILLTGWQAELCCGEDEALVEAAELVRSGLLRQDRSGCEVTYFHLRLDRPEILNVEGLWSESCLPGQRIGAGHDPAQAAEIPLLLPDDRAGSGLLSSRSRPSEAHPSDRVMPDLRQGGDFGRMIAASGGPHALPRISREAAR